MAGVVDIKNGERSDIIRSQNVSRWILTLSKFLQKMDGIENTQAVELTQRDSSGKNPIESVLEGKEDVEKLIIALGNLLSSQMMNEGMVYEAVKVKDLSDISRKYNLMDQLLAIDALLSIHELTKMQNYFASAMDIYGSLRKSLNPKTNFFEVGDDKVSNPVLTSYLTRTMSHVLPYLKPKDQQSLKDQIKIWNYKLQKIN